MAAVERVGELGAADASSEAATCIVSPPGRAPRFDRIATLYRAMEYLSFGPMLERCRFHHIPAVTPARRALILGDGDGRFLARLIEAAPHLRAEAVDASPAMLRLLRSRVAKRGGLGRIGTTCVDARAFSPHESGYDLVATHFFLDCLTAEEAGELIARLRPHLVPGAPWLVSEFQIPEGGRLRRAIAEAIVTMLYAAFRLLTGLRVRRIPPWRALLIRSGFARTASRSWLGGLLISEVWELQEATGLQEATRR